MIDLFLDIETIPSQDDEIKKEIAAPIIEANAKKIAEVDQEIEAIKPPGNLKDPEKISAWNTNERPKKLAALQAERYSIHAGLEAAIDNAWRKTSFDGAKGQIAVVSAAINDDPVENFWSPNWATDEATVVRRFYQWVLDTYANLKESERTGIRVIGHNVYGFDLRFMFQRSVIQGIRPPSFLPFNTRPWDDHIYDTMTQWAGPQGSVPIDTLCRVLGAARKGAELGFEIDGSMVWDFVRDGRIEDVAIYCGGDVGRVRDIYYRMVFRGVS